MAQEDKRSDKAGESFDEVPSDETTQLKKRARRRLIGAVALALLAAIVLPMVMDHQPASPPKDIQVRIPNPNEVSTQRVSPKPILSRKEDKAPAEPVMKEPSALATKPEAGAPPVTEARPETKPEPEAKPKPEPKPEASVGKAGEEVWEVQLGAYQEPGRVKLLVGKLKELGIPTYTEKVETPAGSRTRVRAGPFPSQDAAEKAKVRIKIVGVDGPVARKP